MTKIDIEVILKELNCTVCLSLIEDCYMTRCGHVFCKACILEVINRHHKCPVCQNPQTENDIFKNYHFNNLKKTVLEEREKATKAYLDNLFLKTSKSQEQSELSDPVQDLFRKYLRETIVQYELRFIENREIFKERKNKLQRAFNLEASELTSGSNIDMKKVDQIIEEKRKKLEQNINLIDEQLVLVNKFYLDSLEKSLRNQAPNPDLLEMRLALSVPSKKIRIDPFLAKPNDPVSNLKDFLYEYSLKTDNPLVDFDDPNITIVAVPLGHIELHNHINDTFKVNPNPGDDLLKLKAKLDEEKTFYCSLKTPLLFANLHLNQGTVLYILGNVKARSDLPAECMTYSYVNGMTMDYYFCAKCNINWICEGCKNYCHQGHDTKPYLKSHKTTWACCYCVSKGFCNALNKNNKNK